MAPTACNRNVKFVNQRGFDKVAASGLHIFKLFRYIYFFFCILVANDFKTYREILVFWMAAAPVSVLLAPCPHLLANSLWSSNTGVKTAKGKYKRCLAHEIFTQHTDSQS